MLNIINISFSDSHFKFILTAISFISIYFGIKTITSKNPILSILFLIGLFFCISIYLIYIGLTFIGLSYLLVYIGAISILFIFIIMLINIRTSELLTDNYNSIPLAILIILLFNNSLNDILIKNRLTDIIDYLSRLSEVYLNTANTMSAKYFYHTFFMQYADNYVASLSSKTWDSILVQITQISNVGNILYTNHFIEFMLTSLILLLAMVGCIKITSSNNTNSNGLLNSNIFSKKKK